MNRIREEYVRDRIGIAAVVYAIYCALLPLNMILNFTGITVNKYFGIVAAAFFIIDIIRERKTKLNSEYLFFILFLLWGWISLAWTVSFARSISQLITFTSLVLITELGLLRGFNEREIKLIKYAMIISSAFIIFFLAPNINVSYTRMTLESSAGAADHNGLAANIVFSLVIAVNEIKYERKKWLKIICIICTVSMSISVLLIASRGSYIAAIVSIFLYFIFERYDSPKSFTANYVIKWLLIVLIVVGIGFVIFRFVPIPALNRLRAEHLFENSGYGRTNLWSAALQALWDSVFRVIFGYGFGTEGYVTVIYTGIYAGIHNVYLEYWATTGIIGLTLMLIMMVRPLVYARRNKDNLSFALVVALLIICFPLGFLNNKGAWNVLMLAYIGLQNTKPKGIEAHDRSD